MIISDQSLQEGDSIISLSNDAPLPLHCCRSDILSYSYYMIHHFVSMRMVFVGDSRREDISFQYRFQSINHSVHPVLLAGPDKLGCYRPGPHRRKGMAHKHRYSSGAQKE